ncbi:MAG: DUF302 domain-containing protein [Bacteroidales bacterium]|nr:DUF302 domain-containing protein [Bacteroidales bacterium]MCF8399628.1 DUF302 domain-containing protein [Bacteroidales bacterium]
MKTHTLILGAIIVFSSLAGYAHLSKESQTMEENYYFKTTVRGSLKDVKAKTMEVFKTQGFGLISEIPMHEKLAEKLDDIDMNPYYIMGFCNPGYAYKTLQLEENIGLFLPCKVIVRDNGNGTVDVVAINPEKAMKAIGNKELETVAGEVTEKFRVAIEQMPETVNN